MAGEQTADSWERLSSYPLEGLIITFGMVTYILSKPEHEKLCICSNNSCSKAIITFRRGASLCL